MCVTRSASTTRLYDGRCVMLRYRTVLVALVVVVAIIIICVFVSCVYVSNLTEAVVGRGLV